MASGQRRVGRLIVLSLVAVLVCALVPVAVIAAGGAFSDDDTSQFEQDIEWLATAGVTKGCNPPVNDRFCPGSSVTRGQMAAFMRRFAQFMGAEDGKVAEADHADVASNADTLDGLNPGDLIRINGSMSDAFIDDFTVATWTDVQTASIEAPLDGVLLLTASVALEDDSTLMGNGWIDLRLTIDGTPTYDTGNGLYSVELSDSTQPFAAIGSLNAAVAVSQGSHTVALQAREEGSGTFIGVRSISAVFSAFGGGVPSIPVSVGQTDTNVNNRTN